MSAALRWGLVATIKAEAREILDFAAYHIDAGAHRLFLYLDAPCPEAMPWLKAHPKIRVMVCDEAYWLKRRNGRPAKHQVRQTMNATRCYKRQAEGLDWLIHMDVDEFLYAEGSVAAQLAALPAAAQCARVRPIEALAGDGSAFKAHIPAGPERQRITARLYPNFGSMVKGGFLSHLQGKVFVRPGMEPASFKIHNFVRGEEQNPGLADLPGMDLCHFHAKDWDGWLAHYRYRLERGSYRAELAPNRPREQGGVSMHELLQMIEAEQGESGLRAFYDEMCADSPDLRARLQAEGCLRLRQLEIAAKRQKHFPDFA
jgi:hypothetical protein